MQALQSMKPIDDINSLKGLREELRLQAHLFKKEIKDGFDHLENRWRDLETTLPTIDKASIQELVEAYRRVKKSVLEQKHAIGLKKELKSTFDQALPAVKEALKTEGFGVLSEIDMKETLEEKVGATIARYRILGACNPTLAERALEADLSAGVMMPCNVVVYENTTGQAVVCAIDPLQTAAAHAGPEIAGVAAEVRAKLLRVLERLD
jgi:uncharacterized protein (DUF302 family)